MTKQPTHPEREPQPAQAAGRPQGETIRDSTAQGASEGPGPLADKSRPDPGTLPQKGGGEPMPRLPHERDESHQSQHTGSRPVGRQAASDIERGLEETDLYGSRGRRGGAASEDND
ncbi:hypothetical protein J5T34_17230 [Cupriavidus gilardii]|uniref:hypothetical protein n=1 Tax=Cupriavidus gilardii TaxID=82541 RepID=UPI001ABE92F5|nr:hypothetical protein [Cupriavidus gilardii]MBO4122472.1 hypothetical protein [Cupriavidus gilardii]